ncbi:MAG: PIG-L family deacetylase [Acidimicrobiales bacterium]|jgi:LmbE family N-acetylglucosaminyl deacetylase
MSTAVFLHAHPDDEAITTGGTMALLASQGHRVVLVTATRGELGEVPDGFLAANETLTERREHELTVACQALGVARREFLGYRDSGMKGEPTNDNPECFWQANVTEAAERLAVLLRAERADILTAYDERGVYGHPDHVQVHRVGLLAAELAGTPRVFMATVNRDHLRGLTEAAEELELPELDERREEIDTLGVEAERITTAIDVSAHLDSKRRAMAAHASQISETSFFLALPPDMFAAVWGTEWYIRLGAQAQNALETSLVG